MHIVVYLNEILLLTIPTSVIISPPPASHCLASRKTQNPDSTKPLNTLNPKPKTPRTLNPKP